MPREMERLLALSLAAEDAVRAERWDEAAELLRSRDTVLTELELTPLPDEDAEALEAVRLADARIARALADVRTSLVDEIAQAFQSRRAQGAYTPPPSTHGNRWDRTG